MLDYLFKTVYNVCCNWIFDWLPTPSYLLVFWIIFGGVLTTLVILDTTPVLFISPVNGKASELLRRGVAVHFLHSSISAIVSSVLKANTTLVRNEYISILYFLFIFIFSCNVLGLIPYTFTLTSSFIVTFFLALTHFIAINIIAAYKHSWHFLNLFLPSGVPLFIAPFLVIIETISYFAKVLSLSIRLFANMMSGHALLKILIGFAWTMSSSLNVIFILAGIFPWVIVTVILFLEALIAFLQAYVFVVLIAIYLNDVTGGH